MASTYYGVRIMGLGGIGIWQLLIVLVIVIMLFGTKRLKGLGTDLGDAIKGFRKTMDNDEKAALEEQQGQTITVQARKLEEPARKS
jgi:sec-independent protein translocase protein TatA